ncbi:MAG TPA: LptF/LptG family permease, partial [Nitrospiria bacterium]
FIPWIKGKAEYIRIVDIKKRPELVFFGTEKLWLRDGKRNFINALWVDPTNQTLHQFKYYRIREDFSLEESFSANKATFEDGTWFMVDGTHRKFSLDGMMEESVFSRQPIGMRQKPDELKGLDIKTDEMSFSALKHYIAVLEAQAYEVKRFQVDLYEKISFPLVGFVMTLLAIPLGLSPVRGAGVSRGIGLCLLLGSAYWIIHSLAMAMGHAMWLPPLAAALLANCLFGGIAGVLFLSARS